MHWLLALDANLFRFINQTLSNPVFDAVMPFASGNKFFIPALLLAAVLLLWKGGVRGRLCLLMLVLIVWPADSFITNTIKHAVARPRPYVALSHVRLFGKYTPAKTAPKAAGPLAPAPPHQMGEPGEAGTPALSHRAAEGGGKASRPRSKDSGGYTSMPSAHAANWFAATMILLVFYRRSWRFMLPLACVVAFSRVYNGVHFPSDVLTGAILGSGYAVAGIWLLNTVWRSAGRRWFPLWWEKLPSLVNPVSDARDSAAQGGPAADQEQTEQAPGLRMARVSAGAPRPAPVASLDVHWLRLGYVLIGVLLFLNLAYIASGLIELSGDEAYQWIWSKHLALSYYSKPPLIAYTQFLGTHLWGDNEFGVRFFSPVISAILGVLLLRFFAKEVNARAGFFLLLIVAATPLMALGSILMTIDPLSVLFWTAAMFAGWRAVQPGAKSVLWLWTGLWMGLGFLSKYTELFQLLCWAVFFILWKPARAHLRRPGPYLALAINLVCSLPVLIWNQQHGWITVFHVAYDASIGVPWHPTLRYFFGFLIKESALLNPVFFVAAFWAAIAFWRRSRNDPRLVYLFSMGAPLFLCYWLYTFHSGVLPNWIAPSVLPLFCLMAIYWDRRWRLELRGIKPWLIAGLCIGISTVVLLHDTNLVGKIVGRPLPSKPDPLTRVRGYRRMAEIVEQARAKLLKEGKPVFIIGGHYVTTSLVTFYLPEAKTNVTTHPLVYYITSSHPVNQFYFWPGYEPERKGQNAIFVRELPNPPLVDGWKMKWLEGDKHLQQYEAQGGPPPKVLREQFDSVTDLGVYKARYRGRPFHIIQLFECRDLH